MKSYNEMAQSVLSRINEYEAAEKRKRKILIISVILEMLLHIQNVIMIVIITKTMLLSLITIQIIQNNVL